MATYAELLTLFSYTPLANKVMVACLVAAEVIRSEDVATTNHANRLMWARRVFTDPKMAAHKIMMALLAANKDQSVAAIQSASDASVQTQVNAAVDLFADGS